MPHRAADAAATGRRVSGVSLSARRPSSETEGVVGVRARVIKPRKSRADEPVRIPRPEPPLPKIKPFSIGVWFAPSGNQAEVTFRNGLHFAWSTPPSRADLAFLDQSAVGIEQALRRRIGSYASTAARVLRRRTGAPTTHEDVQFQISTAVVDAD